MKYTTHEAPPSLALAIRDADKQGRDLLTSIDGRVTIILRPETTGEVVADLLAAVEQAIDDYRKHT